MATSPPDSGSGAGDIDETDEAPASGSSGLARSEFDDYSVPENTNVVTPGKAKRWKHTANTRRSLAYAIVGVSLLLYGYLTTAGIYAWISPETYRGLVAGLAPLQALAAATVGFFFGRQSGD